MYLYIRRDVGDEKKKVIAGQSRPRDEVRAKRERDIERERREVKVEKWRAGGAEEIDGSENARDGNGLQSRIMRVRSRSLV